jgi:hypothetical protein
MKTYAGVEVKPHDYWPLRQTVVGGQLQAPAALLPEKAPTVPIGQETGRVPKSVWTLRRREKSYPCRESNPGCPARSPSLYGLSYSGSFASKMWQLKCFSDHNASFNVSSSRSSIAIFISTLYDPCKTPSESFPSWEASQELTYLLWNRKLH